MLSGVASVTNSNVPLRFCSFGFFYVQFGDLLLYLLTLFRVFDLFIFQIPVKYFQLSGNIFEFCVYARFFQFFKFAPIRFLRPNNWLNYMLKSFRAAAPAYFANERVKV